MFPPTSVGVDYEIYCYVNIKRVEVGRRLFEGGFEIRKYVDNFIMEIEILQNSHFNSFNIYE